MKKHMKQIGIVVGLFFFVAACNNPADQSPRAETGPALSPGQSAVSAPAGNGAEVTLPLDPTTTRVEFVGSKVTGNHTGNFERLSGKVIAKGDDPTSARVEVSIDMASVTTGIEKLDGHLRSPDFFDAEKFPNATFTSTGIVRGSGAADGFVISGNLALHGVTKAISFPAEITLADGRAIVKASFSINRRDFNIVYPGMPDDLIRDDVLVRLSVNVPR